MECCGPLLPFVSVLGSVSAFIVMVSEINRKEYMKINNCNMEKHMQGNNEERTRPNTPALNITIARSSWLKQPAEESLRFWKMDGRMGKLILICS